ncbi:DMT family transporter [Limnoraphis robusta Tam1]|uniref:DMT family transporter n=1 Tax=Limnoraphis robusta CCNP1315 TaxID=3110306 RepID=A0ABU5U1Z2_9CYAN|nr:DMT family transporter [Limnoraphis robusta]MEA5500068.1 DMT family transporter [Limnoraphis robusta BA-68 BA1]MEA5521214.1 DMT family transporter [Limnoraphis robusta CCNP1315]MEA5541191.1 DMT family transporter [Limnoraphis robusta Tam1]MEA5548986.1 DMT family transporter [Limnoraphis robusta CCNP1324]
MNLIQRIPGRAYLLLGVTIFGAANAVTRQLTELGAENLIDGRNPISFCNLLFVGNIWAFLIFLLLYYQELNFERIKQISRKDWLALTSVALLAGALGPALFFSALERTTVNNVILISRIEPPLVLALSIFLLNERVNRWVIIGAIVSFIGVGLTVFLPDPNREMMNMAGFQIGIGEFMVAMGAVSAAVATIISKVSLRNISLGFFNLYRNFLSTIIFFIIVVSLFGFSHFMDVFSPFVWQWMLLYSAVIVVGGQFCWFSGLKKSSTSEISLANSFAPLAGVLASYLILGEVPTTAQYLGGSVIILGIILNQIGSSKVQSQFNQSAAEGDRTVGYKGV